VDPVTLYARAADGACRMVEKVEPGQRAAPTPCADWDVDALVTHMAGGPAYLATSLGVDPSPGGTDAAAYRAAVERSLALLADDAVLERRCQSPAGFEWSIGEAVAGTAMDQLVHTWDLAVAIDAPRTLDPELVDAVVAMFLPHMPEVGRQAGIVGAEVPVPAGATPQDRLLGAMGRRP
jgi:uncharacterized protein (TIGR03086 family)